MSLRIVSVIGVFAVLIIAYVAWTRNTVHPATAAIQGQTPGASAPEAMPPAGDPATGAPGMPGAQPPVIESGTNPGLAWSVPSTWTNRGPSSMRLGTYVVKGPHNTEATCAVYYFGPGQGGTVDANLHRWQGEFKNASAAKLDSLSPNGIKVTRVRSDGTYMAHAGMMGQGSVTEMPNWAMLGAIAEGPQGSVFFKFTGPVGVMNAASGDFDKMLKSLHAAS